MMFVRIRTLGFALAVAVLLAGPSRIGAQRLDPAQWSLEVEQQEAPPGSHVLARLTATLEEGWHLYSPTTPPGPIPTTIELAENPAIAGYEIHQQPPITEFDPNFNSDTETYEGEAVFLLDIQLTEDSGAGAVALTARVRYQLCNDRLCLPPRRKEASASFVVDPAAPEAAIAIPSEFGGEGPATELARAAPGPVGQAPARTAGTGDTQGLVGFILVALGFGLAAIFTPCVFPMIPITVSFFLRQQTAAAEEGADSVRRRSVFQATVFCLGIVVLFTSLGMITTAVLGPFGVVELGSNPWVNGFIALVFLAFGLSLLGAFEITLPSGFLTRMDRASARGGYLGTLVMGLTFSLTAFACVGPFVGTLLAASIGSGGLRPLVGMLAFATGLAAPFFLLALFPAWLQRMPRAGGWMARVKVVLGFVILAAMFKYLSNIDQVMQWGILGRGPFLAVWIVLFALAGLYLLGFLRLEGVDPGQRMGMGRLLVGGGFLAVALSLLPGMFGGRLGELEAYVPPVAEGGGFAGGGIEGTALDWMKNQYPEALAKARAENKLVLVNFTGYACTNCHWMKANMFTRSAIAEALSEFVLVDLYTDGADEASAANQQLQEAKFQTVAIPYYAILDPDETIIATFAGLTRSEQEFLAFLRTSPAR